ncbi:Piso0_000939 [Millerozyma farinosa CBS 7064]|uniref:Vacuolar protein sorting-associated protein 29 n=1 Tax=Pichia sorbitophila (strain ATCC MYA-4447 / BCRC 22081 / CBS 7064 / NBRC 10061 / NRRL Y-12695) TaxID=559304 RepID=G8YQG9_PICSO|nr:Piso0_000939 [Millerozyma farinosa CBS 7064]
MLTLVIGDIFIPDRALSIPSKFKKLLCPNPKSVPHNSKISEVICLGNIINSFDTLKFLYNLSPTFHIVRGEFDNTSIIQQQLTTLSNNELQIPFFKVIRLENLNVGFTSGHQIIPKSDPLALLTLARELDVDVLIWGGTHKVEAYILDGKFFINPGSVTGAFNFDWPDFEEQTREESNDISGDGVNYSEKKGDSKESEESENTKVEENSSKAKAKKSPKDEDEPSTIEENDNHKDEKQSENTDEKKSDATEVKGEQDSVDVEYLNEAKELTSNIPSFCLLDTYDTTCTLYIYSHFNGEVKVDKVTYQKE